MHWNWIRLGAAAAVTLMRAIAAEPFVPSSLEPPAVARELRGTWMASVNNIDWPSQPGLSTAQQKAELLALLDRCAQLRFNAVFLQVRPACDALYASSLEPWSEYLTGVMGRAPAPAYDPLAFAIAEAHQRGLELHAWFNPFRAHHASSTAGAARQHISQTSPALVKKYGKSLWLDPGEPSAQEHSLQVILDVVARYDIDGVHFDDYFYPYEEKDRDGNPLPFPDTTTWQRYQRSGGQLARPDWRRENVNTFVRRVRDGVHAQKAWVRFGISPFGIWRPGFPAGVKGLDAYDTLFADARHWLNEGWVDYLAPQLYWRSTAREQSFPTLLGWWAEQNTQGRQLFAGLTHGHGLDEVLNQIQLARRQTGVSGQIHWSAKSLLRSGRGGDGPLRAAYTEPALPPAATWLDATPPARPLVTSTNVSHDVHFNWSNGGSEPVRFWIVQSLWGSQWLTEVLSVREIGRSWKAGTAPTALAVTAVDRAGNAGPPAVLQRAVASGSKTAN